MTADGLEQLKADLERLREELPAAIQPSPRPAKTRTSAKTPRWRRRAKTRNGLNSRINELAYQIAHAVISENQATGRAHLGSTVGVRRLDAGNDQVQRYTLVGPTEVNAEERRISVESPVGKASSTPRSAQLSRSKSHVARCALKSSPSTAERALPPTTQPSSQRRRR